MLRPTALVIAATVALTAAAPVAAGTTAQGRSPERNACSPLVTIESFSDALDKTTFDGTYVGNLSALAVDTRGRIAALSDRSALFTLDSRTVQPTDVVAPADENGQPFDSEGLVVDRDGARLIASETEPAVRRHTSDGRVTGSLPVPAALQVAPAGRATANQTFEGLTLQPGGRTLIAAMEGALAGDSATVVRFQTWKRHGNTGGFRPAAQYGYRVDEGLGVPEIAATGDGRLLVLERGYTSGAGNTVRLYLADPRHATDVSGTGHLTGQAGVRLVPKTLLADIVNCPSLGATAKQPQPNPLLDNIEGMAVTGRTPDGRLRLLLVSDDNQNTSQITRLYPLTARLPKP